MSRGLICVFLLSALFAIAFGELRLIRGPVNFQEESSCVAQNGNKYYLGWVQNSEDEQKENALFSLNFKSGKTERVFPDLTERTHQWMSQEAKNLGRLTTENSGSLTLICAGNKLLLEITMQKEPLDGFTRKHRTHIIIDLDLDISPAQNIIQF